MVFSQNYPKWESRVVQTNWKQSKRIFRPFRAFVSRALCSYAKSKSKCSLIVPKAITSHKLESIFFFIYNIFCLDSMTAAKQIPRGCVSIFHLADFSFWTFISWFQLIPIPFTYSWLHINIGPIFLQAILIPVQDQKIWA